MTYQNARAVVSGGLFALLWSAAASAALPCGTLDEHEKWGGHAVARHVGKTREFLKSRLDDEGIYAASTFASETTAEAAIKAAIGSDSTVDAWKVAKKGSTRKVIKYKSASVTGRSLTQRHEEKDPLSEVKGVTVVLQRATNKCKYRIVTAFPARMP